jgi:hypothetical protein
VHELDRAEVALERQYRVPSFVIAERDAPETRTAGGGGVVARRRRPTPDIAGTATMILLEGRASRLTSEKFGGSLSRTNGCSFDLQA